MKEILEAIKEKLNADIRRETPAIFYHDLIKEVLVAKWKGKILNRRIAEQVKNKIIEYGYGKEESTTIYYEVGYSTYTLKIWGTTACPTYADRIEFYIGKIGEPIDPEDFEKTDVCHGGAAQVRNEQRKALLEDNKMMEKIADAVMQVRTAWGELETLTGEHGTPASHIEYFVRDLTGLRKGH